MKKILAIIAAGAVLAAAATAEVTIGTWLSVQNALIASDGDDIYAGTVNSWGGARYARLNIAGQDEEGRVGFKMDIYDENGEISRGDNAYFWVKPINKVLVAAGQWDPSENGLRGDLCYGSWNWIRPYNWLQGDEGLTFTGAGGEEGNSGLHVQIWLFPGFQIYVGIPFDAGAISNGNTDWLGNSFDNDLNNSALATYISSQVAVAWTLGFLNSTAKAQWLGRYANMSEVKYAYDDDGVLYSPYDLALDDGMEYGAVELAFDFGLIPNLYVTAGLRFRVMDSDLQAAWEKDTMKYAAGVRLELGNLVGWDEGITLYASAALFTYAGWANYYDTDEQPRFQGGIGVDFGIIEGLKVEADVRYLGETKSGSDVLGYESGDDDSWSFLIGVVYSVGSNGEIGLGFQGATNGMGFLGSELQYEDKFAWVIPFRMGVWF